MNQELQPGKAQMFRWNINWIFVFVLGSSYAVLGGCDSRATVSGNIGGGSDVQSDTDNDTSSEAEEDTFPDPGTDSNTGQETDVNTDTDIETDKSTGAGTDSGVDTGSGGGGTDSESDTDTQDTCCDFSDSLPVALGETVTVGLFEIVPTPTGFAVFDSQGGKREVYRSASQPIYAVQSELDATEHQGSFDIKENMGQRCQEARFDSAMANGRTLSLSGDFADCPSLRFTLNFCQPEAGHLRFELTVDDTRYNLIGLRTASDGGERIYGMGEQFPHNTLNLKGRQIPVLAQEGGIGRGHIPISPSVELASPGSSGSEESSYYAAAHYLTNENRSLMLENTEYAVFDFRQDDVIDVRVYAEAMKGRILLGDSPKELIERFTEYAGRMPPLPNWVDEGAIVALARSLDESLGIVESLQAHGAQIAAVWNQTWSGKAKTFIGEQVLWNWVQNENYHPGWSDYVNALENRGIRTLCYINSMFRDVPEEAQPVRRNLFQEGIDGGYFVRKADGSPYLLEVTAFEVGLLDFTNSDAETWMKEVIRDEMIDRAGCSGWMADFAEALPFDAVMSSGVTGHDYHNQYPVEWARLNREVLTENDLLGDVLIFNRSGHTQTPRYSSLLWLGDQLTTWDKYDGMLSALHGLIGGGFSGIALNHSDTGGYTSLSAYGLGYSREEEQLKRWTEMNSFTAVLRTHEGNQPEENAQIYSDDEAMEHFARFTKVYKALGFYRRQLYTEASERGWPVVRHLMLEYPEDVQSQKIDDQFLLGSEILVAPVKNKCWTYPFCPYNKELYLPEGQWVHLWSGKVYGDEGTGKYITVKAPIGKPAVFYRKGSDVARQFIANLIELGVTDVAAAQ